MPSKLWSSTSTSSAVVTTDERIDAFLSDYAMPTALARRAHMFDRLAKHASPGLIDALREMNGSMLRKMINVHFGLAIPNGPAGDYFDAVVLALDAIEARDSAKAAAEDIWKAVCDSARGR